MCASLGTVFRGQQGWPLRKERVQVLWGTYVVCSEYRTQTGGEVQSEPEVGPGRDWPAVSTRGQRTGVSAPLSCPLRHTWTGSCAAIPGACREAPKHQSHPHRDLGGMFWVRSKYSNTCVRILGGEGVASSWTEAALYCGRHLGHGGQLPEEMVAGQ